MLYRDTWGVAHIYAPTVEGGLYAMGWGQAEDRPEQLLLNLLMGIGEYAGAVGEEGVAVDLRSRMFDHYAIAKRGFPELRPELRSGITAFVAGINDFYAAHPADVPVWWLRGRAVDEAMILASGRMFLFNWSIDEAYGDLKRAGIEPSFEAELRGSNQFAIAPSRSAEGAAILAIDPHLSWYGPSRYWEVRIHAGALEGSGVSRAGSPYLGLGHTRNLAWAMTTGGPDTADVYALELDATGARYRYDGAWRDLERRETTIEVRDGAPRHETILLSHHGPLIARHGTKAWAAKIAYHDVPTAFEAIWELNFGADYKGARARDGAACPLPPERDGGRHLGQHLLPANGAGAEAAAGRRSVAAARRHHLGDRVAGAPRCLRAPAGAQPAAGVHAELQHPSRRHDAGEPVPTRPHAAVSVRQPRLRTAPRRLDQPAGRARDRAARGGRLGDGGRGDGLHHRHPSVRGRPLDRGAAGRRPARRRRLRVAAALRGGSRRALRLGRRARREVDRSAGLRVLPRTRCIADLGADQARQLAARVDDLYAVVEARAPRPLALDAADRENARHRAGARGEDRLVANHGSLAATYGDRFRVGRGERSWPVEGGGEPGSEGGTTTLRNMGYAKERDDKTRWGERGQTSTQIVVMSKPPRSWLYIPLGQSDRPDSPHFSDQAEKAFSPRRLKPSWWLPEDLAGHIESRRVLVRSPSPD